MLISHNFYFLVFNLIFYSLVLLLITKMIIGQKNIVLVLVFPKTEHGSKGWKDSVKVM